MRLVVQRVNKSSVRIKDSNKIVGEIGKGLFVLLGVGEDDNKSTVDKFTEQIIKLRIMADEEGKMNLCVLDLDAEILVVSQFTLYADTSEGNRPSFLKAGSPEKAEELYEYFIERLKQLGVKTESGSFGDYMIIDAHLDGPSTIILED